MVAFKMPVPGLRGAGRGTGKKDFTRFTVSVKVFVKEILDRDS
jgi:hypothetical protein